jgi:hypothetical protein
MKSVDGLGLTLYTSKRLAEGTLLGIYGGSVSRAPPPGSCHDVPFSIYIRREGEAVVKYNLVVYHLPQAGESDPSRMLSASSHCCKVIYGPFCGSSVARLWLLCGSSVAPLWLTL